MMKKEPYYAAFTGKTCELRTLQRRVVRKFTMLADIVNAQVQDAGDETYVAITCKNGITYVYTSDGRLIHRS